MHTFHGNDGGIFVYNSDLSGNIEIINKKGETVEISGEDLARFITRLFSDFGRLIDGMEERYTWGKSHIYFDIHELDNTTIRTLKQIEILK